MSQGFVSERGLIRDPRPLQETTWNDPNDPLAASATPLHKFIAAFNRDIEYIKAKLTTANSGGTTVFNVKIEGTTILSGGAMTIADLGDFVKVTPTTTAWDENDELTVETVSSAGGAAKATVIIVWRERWPT